MRKNLYLAVFFICLIFTSCNKTDFDIASAPAAVNLVNAVAGNNVQLNVNFTGTQIIYSEGKKLGYYEFDGKYVNGLLTLGLRSENPIPLVVALSTDTIKPIFNQSVTFRPGDIYSLFICGKPESPAYLFVKDSLNAITDSVTSVRFINLSQDIDAVSINIIGQRDGSEIKRLKYKQISNFKTYPAKVDNSLYVYEIRDAGTQELLTTFYYDDVARFRHVTLILRGLKDTFPGLEVVRMNNW